MELVPKTPPAQMNFPFGGEPAFATSEREQPCKRRYRERRFFRWSRAAREMVRANLKARGAELSELADRLETESGNPRDACLRFARQLGVTARRKHGKWPQSDQQTLLDLLEEQSVQKAAATMQRSEKSVYNMLYRLGLSARMRQDWFTIRSLAEALDMHNATIRRWIQMGWLKATRRKIDTLTWTTIEADDFARFCKQHADKVIGNRLHKDRLEFVHRFVFPPSHAELLWVRDSKKERAAYKKQMMAQANAELEDEEDVERRKAEPVHPWDRIA